MNNRVVKHDVRQPDPNYLYTTLYGRQ